MTTHDNDEQEAAVAYVLSCVNLPAGSVTAKVTNGGPSIHVRNGRRVEVFIGRSYKHAAEVTVAFYKKQGSNGAPVMNRHRRRAIAARARKSRKKAS